jgi:alkanesulfonate monooxygenase SsuD/methylene tetrahydromethanopterin reductase-like flavin-dependent oxidoreductase (luciferase family)
VLSVLDPVRVYQDFATLDLVSHGRAEIIAGRSAFAEPFALFGEDIAQLDDLYAEKLDPLLRLRNEDRVTWTGRFRPPLQDAAPNPQQVDPLPIWVASAAPPPAPSAPAGSAYRWPSASSAAASTTPNGSSTSTGPAGRDAGHPEEQLTVAITSHFYVGETQEHALGASGIFGAPHSAEEMRRRLAVVARAA